MWNTRNARRLEELGEPTIAIGVVLVAGTAFLVLLAGVTSTVVDWIPQPTLETLTMAFAVHLVMMVGISLVRIGRIALDHSSLSGVLLDVGISVVVAVPFLYILIYAVGMLWVELTSSFGAHAAFFFVIAILVAQMVPDTD